MRFYLINKLNFKRFLFKYSFNYIKKNNYYYIRNMQTKDNHIFKLALCQMLVSDNKNENILNATKYINMAIKEGANIISLPECWNCPYNTSCFPKYAEIIPDNTLIKDINLNESPSIEMLIILAKKYKIYLIGGSIPEKEIHNDPNEIKIYNTCVVVNPLGEIIAKHRKIHLFDIDVPGRITFKESDTLSPGNNITVFSTPYCTVGIGICYDIRFPELSMLMKEKNADLLIFPGAFNLTTGPSHWELLQRARAVDNMVYVAAVSQARGTGENGKYQAWGHSTIVNPWGDVISTTQEKESIVYADIDLQKVKEMRTNIPVEKQKRYDIYKLIEIPQDK